MGTRVTLRALTEAALAAKQADPGVAIAINANAVAGNRKLKFYGVVTIGAAEYDLAGANGKLKLFGDVDDLVKYMSDAIPMGSGTYVVNVNTGVTLADAVPNDLVKAAAAQVVKLQAAKVAQNTVLAAIDAQLALMDGWGDGSPLQVAKLEETQTQRAAVVADIAAIDAEIVRLTP